MTDVTIYDSTTADLVSVIVPVYNAQEHLRGCVSSIQNQEYKNLEIILINDGSKDDSGKICDELAAKDSRIVVIHQKNGGIGAAQNAGLKVFKGKFLTFCDNDDLMSPFLVSRLVEILEQNNADMSTGRWLNVGVSKSQEALENLYAFGAPSGKIVKIDNPVQAYQQVFSKISRMFKKDGEFYYFNEAHWCKLYRREVWEGVLFPVRAYGQDVYINTELYTKIKSVASCDNILYLWIMHQNSTTHTKKNETSSYEFDIVDAAFHNLEIAKSAKVLAARSTYMLKTSLKRARRYAKTPEEIAECRRLKKLQRKALKGQSLRDKFKIWHISTARKLETAVYDKTIHRRK
jgi:glycosyltransferase involved in cell wall biosynthesis